MSLFTRTRSSDPVPLSRVRTLGTVRAVQYATIDGGEFILHSSQVDKPDELSMRPGAVVVSIPRYVRDNGRELEVGHSYRLAEPVPPGTFDAERQKRARRSLPATMRPLDALDEFAMLAPRQPRIIGGASVIDDPIRLRGTGSLVDGRGPIRGRAILDALQRRDVTLSAAPGGRLLASAPRGHAAEDVRRLLDVADRLLLGYVTDKPLRCELRHRDTAPEASTVLVGGTVACAAHAAGELAL
jgi:hypothetical protein